MSIKEFMGNNALMMIAGFIVAMLFGGFPEAYPRMNKDLAMLSLMVMMTFSLCSLRLGGLNVRKHTGAVWRAFLLSFVLSTGTTILMAFLFTGDIRSGWIIEAAVPSAVSVIPFVVLLRGDAEATLVSSAALYIIALALTPVLTLLFIGHAVDPLTLLWYVAMLIVIPLALSRPLRRAPIGSEGRHIAINLAFFCLVIAVCGSNRGAFFGDPALVLPLLAVAIVRTFGIGIALDRFMRWKGMPREERVSGALFATHKNTGMAAALAIALIGDAAALPAAVCMTVDIAWLIYVSRFMFPPAPTAAALASAPS
ncbi:bile acid:sodium symporter [Methanomassiliicoccus luminyensis]|uniref:bile acid:sodium symporter n=1 Tax=Methanomassiliicoccus luminyensis TaxID=1080712 RepID=UPI0003672EEF|nr:hypothetical protein [Methanomassiliicoccus luminyensis]